MESDAALFGTHEWTILLKRHQVKRDLQGREDEGDVWQHTLLDHVVRFPTLPLF